MRSTSFVRKSLRFIRQIGDYFKRSPNRICKSSTMASSSPVSFSEGVNAVAMGGKFIRLSGIVCERCNC